MLTKYISSWWLLIFIIWLIGHTCSVGTITNNINPCYTSIVLCLGLLILKGYYYITEYYEKEKNEERTVCFEIFTILYHSLPIIILYRLNKIHNKGAIVTLLVTLLLYISYMIYMEDTPYNIYIVNPCKSWDKSCLESSNKREIVCRLINKYK